MVGKQQVRERASGKVTWHWPVDVKELVASGEYEVLSDVDPPTLAAGLVATTLGAPIADAASATPAARADRRAALLGLSAAEVRGLAETYGVKYENKPDAIDAILEQEFPEE